MKWNPQEYAQHSANQLAWARQLFARMGLRGSESILDIGSGDGKVSAELGRLVPHGSVLAVDTSREFLDYAPRHFPATEFPNLEFRYMDARRIACDRQFDLIFSNAALHWVDDHRAVLRGCARVLRAGGRLFFSFGGAGNASEVIRSMDELIAQPPWQRYFHDFTFPYYFYGPDQYRPWLAEAGLHPTRVELVEKDMVHNGVAGLAGCFRATWLPYTQHLPEALQEQFISANVNHYLDKCPLDPAGQAHVRMVRLEVEALKP